MPEVLLRTKLFVPPLRPNLVPRPHLIERLNQGLQLGNKLTLISAPACVSLSLPESWTVTLVLPGQSAILQSYPEGKYIGGEAFEPGDTKCDLTIRPPDIGVAEYLQQLKSDPTITIVSEQEIVLQSGEPGTRIEVESMGRSISLITEVNERTVVLTCFGELAPFDEIAVTLGVSE